MKLRTNGLGLGLFLLLGVSATAPVIACEPPQIEFVAADAAFIGRVLPLSTTRVEDENGIGTYVIEALVTERVRGASGRVTLASWALLPEQEILVFGRACEVGCPHAGAYWVAGAIPLDVVASATLGGDWFEMGSDWYWSFDPEVLDSRKIAGPEQARTVTSWRSLTRMISGADAYVSCLQTAETELMLNSGCEALPEGDEQSACWMAVWEVIQERQAACQR